MILPNSVLFVLVIIKPFSLFAQINNTIEFSNYDERKNCLYYSIVPTIEIGTHINSFGCDLLLNKEIQITDASGLNIGTRSEYKYNLSYLGIPGMSNLFEQQIVLSWLFGKEYNTSFYKQPLQRKHTISYYSICYLSTDKTSQISGGLSYKNLNSKRELNIIFEDDFLAFRSRDEYRTFSMELNCKILKSRNMYGFGTKLMFWTGTTTGLGFLHRNQVYDLSNQHGGKYSNGIASIVFYFQSIRLSVGYDSEKIRTFFQNGFHYMIDDGIIPALNRADRVFIQLAFQDIGSLY